MGNLGTAATDGASPRPANRPYLPARSSPAEELIGAIGFKPRDVHSRRHFETLKNFSALGIDSSQIALLTFPSGVPQLSIDPRHSGDKAVGLDGAKNRT